MTEDSCEWMHLAPDPDGASYLCLTRGTDGLRVFVRVVRGLAYKRPDGTPVWHYELSADGTRITLTGAGSNSVKLTASDGHEIWHPTVTNWPITPA